MRVIGTSRLIAPIRLRSHLGEAAHKVTWLELFFDLIFVAAVAQVAEPLHDDYSFAGAFRFATLFALIWWAWTGYTAFATRFHADDAVQRLLMPFQMFVVAAMALPCATLRVTEPRPPSGWSPRCCQRQRATPAPV